MYVTGKPSTPYTMENVYGIGTLNVISGGAIIVAENTINTGSNGIYQKNDQTIIPDAYFRSGPYTSYFFESEELQTIIVSQSSGGLTRNQIILNNLNSAAATCGFFYICGSAGNLCTENAQCCGTGSTCSSGRCCPENYEYSAEVKDCIRKAICLDECNGPYQLCKPNGDYETCTQGTDGCYDFKLVKPTVY